MILVIDNYDSFTFNIVQILQTITDKEIRLVRNDEFTVEELAQLKPESLIISPGPGSPYQAGICEEAVKYFAGKIPILGICLGHQAICEAFGARIVQAKYIRHGIVENIKLDGRGLFRSIGKSAKFTRYHSLVADESTLPQDFEVTARAKDGDIMGVRHKTLPIEGIQFHPESIASEHGAALLSAFINYRRDNIVVADCLNQLIAKKDLSE
ncbi:MAG: gamma-glutamyl-gamma-aminobutyrate hydrolase family protein, partial [Treponema sp.]|nr:gamma-glutamyl-gamma-aminobutyrate hydrolase family protein [Treponema sp.]